MGVDAGGTWIRIVAVVDDRSRAVAVRRANHVPELGTYLPTVWRRHRWRGRVSSLVVATRGVWEPRERRALARRLRGLADRVRVIPDVEAAWHAVLGGSPGVLVLAGTGSIVLAGDARGRWARAGGVGPLLGDEGSAFWLGRQWLQATATDAVRRRYAVRSDAVSRIAALAPLVLGRARRGDPTAAAIVRAGQEALAAQTRRAVRALGLRAPVAVGTAGGVMRDPWFRTGLGRALARTGLDIRWKRPTGEPALAAARLAAGAPWPSP